MKDKEYVLSTLQRPDDPDTRLIMQAELQLLCTCDAFRTAFDKWGDESGVIVPGEICFRLSLADGFDFGHHDQISVSTSRTP